MLEYYCKMLHFKERYKTMKHNNIDVLIEESPLHIEILLKFCGYHEKLPPGNVYGDVISGDYILQYCTCGKGEFIVDNKSFHIDKGDCMITFPGQMRIEKADDKEPWGLMWIGINGKSTEFLFQRLNITKENPVIKNLADSSPGVAGSAKNNTVIASAKHIPTGINNPGL